MNPSLQTCLLADSDALSTLGDTVETKHGPLTHIDNGGNILAVVHRDYVCWNDKPIINDRSVRKCPQLDDRLGLYAILNELPRKLKEIDSPVQYDVLITDSEEMGESTAQYFKPDEFGLSDRYNWIFQFDRAGSDAVMYEYHTEENAERLEQFGYKIGHGSFTDICSLTHLGVAGWNLGTGYHKQHSHECYADLPQLSKSIERFAHFANEFHTTRIEHSQKADYTDWEGDLIESIYCSERGICFPVCAECNASLTYDDFTCPICNMDFACH